MRLKKRFRRALRFVSRHIWVGQRVPALEDRLNQLEAGWRQHTPAIEDRLNQLEAGWRQQTPALEGRLNQLEAGWRQHIPAFLNAVSSVAAFGHELATAQSELAETNGRLNPIERDLATVQSATMETTGRLNPIERELATVQSALAETNGRLNPIERDLATVQSATMETTGRLNFIHRELATVQSALAETNGRLGSDIGRLWDRIEFIRRETLLEMKYTWDTPQSGAASSISVRILNEAKVAQAKAQGIVRLNMGCGHVPLEDNINIDMRDLPGVDVLADVGDMPFEPNSVSELFSAHLLEHFPQEELCRRLLPYWKHLLTPGGDFRAVVPDGEAMLASIAAGTYAFEDFREVLFGAQDYRGDFHFNLFTPDSLRSLLEDAGFVDVEVPVSGRRNGKCFEFEIIARRA